MDQLLPTLILLASRAAEDRILQAVADDGQVEISRPQARLLAGLDPNGTRVVVLADRARVAKQTAVSLIDRLEAAGVVVRVPDPTDGRARLVRLSPAGERALRVARTAEAEVEAEWAGYLGPVRARALREALEQLREIADPEGAAASAAEN